MTARYEQLLVRFSGMTPEPGDPLLFTHVQLVSEWQRFPFLRPAAARGAAPGLDRAPRRGGVGSCAAQWYDDVQARWREIDSEDGVVG